MLTSFCFGFNSQCQAPCPHGCSPHLLRLWLPGPGHHKETCPSCLGTGTTWQAALLGGHVSHPVWALIPHCSLLPYPLINASSPCSSFDIPFWETLSQKYAFYATGIARRLVCLKWNQWWRPRGEDQLGYGLWGYFKDFGFCSKGSRKQLEVSSDMI